MTRPWRLREEAKNRHELARSSLQQHASPLILSSDDQGTGIIIDGEGYILTCNHVIAEADALFIRTANGREYIPERIWCDPTSDLALIRIETTQELREAPLGNSDEVKSGDWVISVASPYDLEQTISAGIVSRTDRRIPGTPHPLIQNDAATNPGSSGGALVNLDGKVIGVIIGGFSTTGEFQGIGLAIPVNIAKQVAEHLRTKGRVQRGYLGIQAQMLSPQMAKLLDAAAAGGLYVKEVENSSPAELAGVQAGDIILEYDNQPIGRSFDIQWFHDDATPGKKHTLTLLRDHQTLAVKVEMGRLPIQAEPQIVPDMPATAAFEYFDQSLGLGLRSLNRIEAQELELPQGAEGVLITHVATGGIAYIEGLAAGMAIVRMNDHAIKSLSDYQRLRPEHSNEPALMLVQSDQGRHLVMVGNHEGE